MPRAQCPTPTNCRVILLKQQRRRLNLPANPSGNLSENGITTATVGGLCACAFGIAVAKDAIASPHLSRSAPGTDRRITMATFAFPRSFRVNNALGAFCWNCSIRFHADRIACHKLPGLWVLVAKVCVGLTWPSRALCQRRVGRHCSSALNATSPCARLI